MTSAFKFYADVIILDVIYCILSTKISLTKYIFGFKFFLSKLIMRSYCTTLLFNNIIL